MKRIILVFALAIAMLVPTAANASEAQYGSTGCITSTVTHAGGMTLLYYNDYGGLMRATYVPSYPTRLSIRMCGFASYSGVTVRLSGPWSWSCWPRAVRTVIYPSGTSYISISC